MLAWLGLCMTAFGPVSCMPTRDVLKDRGYVWHS